MLVEADRTGCLREVLVIAAALSVQDPRERPVEQRQAADEKHARFAADGSDFLSYLNLWRHVAERREALSGSRFRKELRAEFLHFLRIREWQDLHAQLRQAARNAGLTPNDADASPDKVHIAVLSGLLSQVGLREGETREYLGARGAHFMIFPGSPLAKKNPRWVMAAELVETSRLFARTVAKIQPEWIEPLAGHLVKRTYSEPHWSRKRAAAVAVERVTLHGVPIVVDRRVDYGRIDPETSRDLFIRHALVEGDWDTRHPFFRANRALLEDVEELETRARRRDLSVDEETLFAFYDGRIPADVVSGRHFDTWWKKQRDKGVLDFTEEMVRTAQAAAIDPSAYPDHVEAGGLTLPLSYAFEPGRRDDGITVDVPVAALQQVDPTPFTWQVPGLREELVTALIKTLPKTLRRQFAPAPDHARAVLARLNAGDEPAARRAGTRAGPDARRHDPARRLGARPAARAPHRHVPGGGRARSRRSRAAPTWRRCAASSPRRSRRSWPPPTSRGPGSPPGRSASCRARSGCGGAGTSSPGTRGWSTAATPSTSGCSPPPPSATPPTPAACGASCCSTRPRPPARCTAASTAPPASCSPATRTARSPPSSTTASRPRPTRLINAAGGPCWDERGYARLKALFAKRLPGTTQQVLDAVRGVLTVWHRVQSALADLRAVPRDLTAQLDALVGPGFATRDGATRLGRRRPLPGGGRAADREAARRPGPRRGVDGGGGRRRRRVRAARGRAPARRRAVARAARDPLDDRGAAGEPLRAPDAHALPGVRPAHPAGHRRPVTLMGESPFS